VDYLCLALEGIADARVLVLLLRGGGGGVVLEAPSVAPFVALAEVGVRVVLVGPLPSLVFGSLPRVSPVAQP
jgi:hypothetical protein